LYRNNGDGTFTDVTKQAGVADGRWSTGAAFADYDGDGFVDLMVTNYVDFKLNDLPGFGKSPTCKYRGIDVQCGPRGLKGAGDSLFHNNGDGTFTDVSKAAGVNDPSGYYGLGVVWSDFNNTGRPDIYVANDSTPNYMYRNDGNGKFTEIAWSPGPQSAKTVQNKGQWGWRSLTTTTPADSRSTSLTLRTNSTRYMRTRASGISRHLLQFGSSASVIALGQVGRCFHRSG